MEKIREKNTAWLETIRSFFVSEEDSEDEKNNGYEEWKRANADIIDQKAIANLEKMLEHQAKKSRKTQIQSKDDDKTKLGVKKETENMDKKSINQGEQQNGRER